MPKLGFDMQEGTLAAWVKQINDTVKSGDVLVEVETDKATVEVEVFSSGTLLKTLVEPGDIVEVGAPIAILGEAGEDISGVDPSSAGGEAEAEAAPEGTPAPAPASLDKEQGSEGEAPAAEEENYVAPEPEEADYEEGRLPDGVKASPVARRLAQERGIDLKGVKGTGPSGRIVKADIENYQPAAKTPQEAAPKDSAPSQPAAAGMGAAPSYRPMSDLGYEEIQTSRLRATIARRMTESKQFVPHFTVTTAMDTAAMLKLRKEINATLDEESKVTVNDLIVKATALTLLQFPNLNTHWYGEKLMRYKSINIGIAVALPEGGLMNVVARDADKTSLSAMARRNKEMIARAREGKVKPDDIEGSTFTVSNLGAFGVEHFTAIINPPEAGILAIGASKATPIVLESGEVGVGNLMKVTISVDHRVSDGAEGAAFLQTMKEIIENPMRLLV